MDRKLANDELNRISVEKFKETEKTPIVVVLDNIRSLNNIGAVFRTADAFLVQEICLCGITAKPPHRDIQKTALGATESVNWSYHESTIDAIEQLKAEGFHIIAIEQTQNSVSLQNAKIKGKVALIFGNEVAGVAQEVIDKSDGVIEIPQYGTKHSLNISVSAGIVLWELQKQLLKH